GPPRIEAPDAVTELDFARQAGLHEVRQIAVEGDAVPDLAVERLDDLWVADGTLGGEQLAQHGDARCGGSQPDRAEQLLELARAGCAGHDGKCRRWLHGPQPRRATSAERRVSARFAATARPGETRCFSRVSRNGSRRPDGPRRWFARLCSRR